MNQAMPEDLILHKLLHEWQLDNSRGLALKDDLYSVINLCRATPAMIDALWADGWRHFGPDFFRQKIDVTDQNILQIIPLRIDLQNFALSKSHRRICNKNKDLHIQYVPYTPRPAYQHLFNIHAQRFGRDAAPGLQDILGSFQNGMVCPVLAQEIYLENTLIAVSFIDIGQIAVSSVYAVYDISFSKRALGIYSLLEEALFAKRNGFSYLYPGYAHTVQSHYDYKKQFTGTEYYNWKGIWQSFPGNDFLIDNFL